METDLRQLLQELEENGQRNDALEQDRSKKMLNLEPPTAQLLSLLVRSSKRRQVLEIGSSNGYSTIWLAWSVQQSDGHLTSIDRDERKIAQADTNLRKAGLRERVELMHADATEAVAALVGPFDCVFFDADRFSAPAQLQHLQTKLTDDVLLLADNALSHPQEIAGYLAAVQALPGFDHQIIPVGKGLSVSYRQSTKL